MWACEWNRKKKDDNEIRDFVSSMNLMAPLKPEDAFCGGRTNAVKLYHECTENEKIHYIDVVGLLYCMLSSSSALLRIFVSISGFAVPNREQV